MDNQIGERIKAQREKKGVSLQRLSDDTGISKTHLWELESKRVNNPTIRTLLILEDYFDCGLVYLIGKYVIQ